MRPSRASSASRLLPLFSALAAIITAAVAQSGDSSISEVMVGAIYNVSAPAGSEALLPCQSQRMVWTQDRLRDRQRVVHWDVMRTWANRAAAANYAMERVLDMFSAGDQRLYNAYNQGRVTMAKTAFNDGNFSLVIEDVVPSDRGLYTCNLHHHYCHLYETVKVQLNVTTAKRKVRKFWDGEKAVFVVLAGSTAVLPCVNRRSIWTSEDGPAGTEEQQQVVHWDWQAPGIRHDRADRLVDLYASGEQRHYGPTFVRRRMDIATAAFARGDFSLRVSELHETDQGLYTCHLHHHYCGLHERRVFRLIVTPPVIRVVPATRPPVATPPPAPPRTQTSSPPLALPNEDPGSGAADRPRVINVILPDQRTHFLQQLGYVLATLLMLALVLLAIILLTRRNKARVVEYDPRKVERCHSTTNDIEMVATEMSCHQEEPRLDYKNNLMKEKAEMSKVLFPKDIDLDKEMAKACSH